METKFRGYAKAKLIDHTNNTSLKIDAWASLDLAAQYSWSSDSPWLVRDSTLTIGIENVTDEAPPFAAGAFADGYDASLYSAEGRRFMISLSRLFDQTALCHLLFQEFPGDLTIGCQNCAEDLARQFAVGVETYVFIAHAPKEDGRMIDVDLDIRLPEFLQRHPKHHADRNLVRDLISAIAHILVEIREGFELWALGIAPEAKAADAAEPEAQLGVILDGSLDPSL